MRWLLLSTFLLASAPALAQDEFVELFNGKDLTGWEGNTELWSVQDGAITGTTNGPEHLKYNQFLIWKGGTVGNFELRLQFRLEGDNNSGVQYRSKQLKEAGDFVVAGYQADMHGSPTYTGMLYDERGRGILAERGQKVRVTADGKKEVEKLDVPVTPIKMDEWHDMTIIARGKRLIHKIDNVVTVEVIDDQESEREMEGILAFQVHRGPAMKVQFKNIRLKDLGGRRAARQRPEEAQPQWVWKNVDGKPAEKVYFRKVIEGSTGIAAARLYATCDNEMTVYLDGEKILTHGEWSSPVFKDVTKSFDDKAAGKKHVLAIEGRNAGTNNPAGLLVKLNFESGWRNAWSTVTDGSWQVSTKKPAEGWLTADFDAKAWEAADVVGTLGGAPWNSITGKSLAAAAQLHEPTATPIEDMKVAKDFQVELLYSVPKDKQGSWVNMCVDPKGRLIVCDQYGGLFRVTPPAIGTKGEIQLEPINVDIGEAQGLLWAFDSLYVMVNRGGKYKSGLYRVRDTNGDDQLDSLETIREIEGGGEHGPHAILLAPDGKSLYLVFGDGTKLTDIDTSRVPQVWDEDLLLPRPYGRGFMKGVPAPGGYICRIDPDGKKWELVATGFRNQFDAAFNADGELFSYDADMEWDMNTPWYRPTRVCHVVSGAEFGWRNGGGKWPIYYPDSLPGVVDIGPGSPTGICFGYGTKFPAKYQQSLFICDWSYGKLYNVNLVPVGATYSGIAEEFVTGTPLPLTDVVVNPHDGALYFTIGGRRVQSGLYRVTYTGSESTAPADAAVEDGAKARELRMKLESLHVGNHPKAIETAWRYLGHRDRFVRYAARIAVEHRPVSEWQERALKERDPQASLTALLALVRQFEREPLTIDSKDKEAQKELDTPAPHWEGEKRPQVPAEKAALRDRVLGVLANMDWSALSRTQRLELMRIYTLTFLRLGPPEEETRQALISRFDSALPAGSVELNTELLQALVYLQAPSAALKGVTLLGKAPTQEEQMAYAKSLRHLRAGWTPELQHEYFSWFVKASGYRGGASFSLFVKNMRDEAVELLSDEAKERLKPVLEAQPDPANIPLAVAPRPFVKEWKMEELLPLVQNGLKNRDFQRGRQMFAAANCFACHRFDNQGGAIGPDLTALSGRFSSRDVLESVVDPSKVISDQYAAVTVVTFDGKTVSGRIVNLAGDSIRINTNMLDPDAQVGIDRKQIEEMFPSKVSMMPTGLLNTLNEDEILDLMAYLLSRGDPEHAMFQTTAGP